MTHEYLAGFVDGEGALTIIRIGRPNGRLYYRPVLTIGNTHLGVLQAIKDFVGAGWICNGREKRTNRKQIWAYTLTSGEKLVPLLAALRPHLIVKAAQADEIMAFVKTLRRKGRQKELSGAEIASRDARLFRLRTLNARGPALAAEGPP